MLEHEILAKERQDVRWSGENISWLGLGERMVINCAPQASHGNYICGIGGLNVNIPIAERKRAGGLASQETHCFVDGLRMGFSVWGIMVTDLMHDGNLPMLEYFTAIGRGGRGYHTYRDLVLMEISDRFQDAGIKCELRNEAIYLLPLASFAMQIGDSGINQCLIQVEYYSHKSI